MRVHPSHEPAETENTNKHEENETVRGDLLHDLPEWLEEFTENVVDEKVRAYRDAPACFSHEVRANKLDVQETDFSFAQFNRI